MSTLHAYLTDFGLAKTMSSAFTCSLGSKTLNSVTPGFQAPEQLLARNIDTKCDMYTFGCVLIEFFGGRPLWSGMTQYQIMYALTIKNEMPSSGHIIIDGIREVVSKCICEHEKRSSSSEILTDLISLLK